MIKLTLTLLLFLMCYESTTHASSEPTQPNLNQIMTNAGNIMIEIYPLVVAKRPLTNEEIDSIDNAITNLSYLFYDAKPFINEKSDGYQISYEFVSEYLNVVKSILNAPAAM